MPALVLFGRRSRIGSDDLYCPALFLVLYQLPLVFVSALFVGLWRRCSSMALEPNGIPFWYLLGAIPVHGFMTCIYLMIMHISAKGTIIAHERRMLMPRLLHVHLVWSLVVLVYGIIGLVFWYRHELCSPDSEFVLVIASLMVVKVLCTFTFGFCILAGAPEHDDPDESIDPTDVERSLPNSDVYVPHHQKWERRCNRCCACLRCFTCNLFGGNGTQHDSMSVVARVFTRLFYGSPDLVVSDIVAGFILLAAVQAHEEAVMEGDLLDEGLATIEELRSRQTGSQLSSLEAGTSTHDRADTATMHFADPNQTKHNAMESVAPLTSSRKATSTIGASPDQELMDRVLELAHFSKFAIGIYGWMLYVWSHPWSGTFRLAFSCAKRDVHYIHGDNLFHLHQAALQLETRVRVQDIVYASFRNYVYHPAFCVLLDHERHEVVVAIRGTLSLEDCLTDAIAYGYPMDEVAERWGCEGHGEYAHQGFLHCAETIYKHLNRLGVLEMLFEPHSNVAIMEDEVNVCERGAYKDYGLVVTGHSLGAGTAVLLSVILRAKYPNLRCFAFSPPGCTMSPSLAQRCNAFVTSVVLGYDIIACASLTSAEELRDKVIELIGRSKVGKTQILRQVVAWKTPAELLHDECSETMNCPFGVQLANYRTMLQRIQDSEPIHQMTIPGRVIHLRRSCWQREPGGCWVCCRPGRSVCCTERTDYQFFWSSADQFRSIRVARTMLDDHFPDKVHHVLQDCATRMRPRELQCIALERRASENSPCTTANSLAQPEV